MSRPSATILLVEDDEAHIELLRRSLAAAGHPLAVTGTLAAAAVYLERNTPAVLLLDVCLPDGSGLDFLTRQPQPLPWPVLVMSSHCDARAAVTAMKAGAADYLLKADLSEENIPPLLQRLQADWARQQEQQKQLAAAEMSAAVFAAAADSIVLIDTQGRIVRVNPQAERTFGYTHAELLGQSITQLLPAGLPPQSERWMSDAPADTLALTGRSRDGREVPLQISAAPLHMGRQTLFVLLCRDVSRSLLREESLRLVHKMEAIGRLASGVAHDFNNMLTVILGYSTLMLSDADTGREQQQYLQAIEQAARRAADLTRQLLAFGQQQMLSPGLRSLNDLLRPLQRMLPAIVGENIEVRCELADELPAILIDGGQLEPVVLTLAAHTREAMPQGGVLCVRTGLFVLDELEQADHPGLRPGRYVRLEVADTGAGMDRETRQRIFEPFFSAKTPGTGLGLASVYGAVQQAGGHIEVRSAPGQGTTFLLYFPAQSAAATPAGASAAAVSASQLPRGRETVLLVEDETDVCALALAILRRSGYHVLTASDGTAALQLASQYSGHIDILVTDVIMPGMTGLELARHVRRLRPAMKVLYMSGYLDTSWFTAADSVSHPLLTKPFPPLALAWAVRNILDGQPLTPASEVIG